MAGADTYESVWMPELAKLLRTEDRELSVVVGMVAERVCKGQQPQSEDRLKGPLKLYYKCKCIIIMLYFRVCRSNNFYG